MDTHGMTFTFSGAVWFSEWYFVSLPQDVAVEIRELFKSREEGWGRLKVTAKIGGSQWKTAIWFDTKNGTYLLPIKKDVDKGKDWNRHQRFGDPLDANPVAQDYTTYRISVQAKRLAISLRRNSSASWRYWAL